MAQYPANIDLSGLNGTTGFKLSGAAAYDASGVSVASAGDVNGDGFADLIIGAFGADPHGTNSGASYVVFGKASGFAASIDLSSLNGSNGFKLSGEANDDYSGGSVASAGDVNGDGFADLIIGAAGSDAGSALDGASYVVFGKASGFAANVDLSTLNGTDGFKLSGSEVFAQTGFSVAAAGDVNHDGFDDVIVGAPRPPPRAQFRCELCGVRQSLWLCRQHRPHEVSTARLASSSAAWISITTAAFRSRPPATSTATASPTWS